MRYALLTYGSRGDVQPLVALGAGLRRAGHDVTLAAPERFADFAAAHGLDFVPLPGDPTEMSRRLVEQSGLNYAATVRVLRDFALPLGVEVFAQMQAAVAGADAVVYTFLLAIPGHYLARRSGIPDFFAHLIPMFFPTPDFPPPTFPHAPLFPATAHRALHGLFNAIFWQANRISYKTVFKRYPEHRLPPPDLLRWPLAPGYAGRPLSLGAYSRHVLDPAGYPPDMHITGYWYLDAAPGWSPPRELLAFLEAGPPPVAIGFGSMVADDMDGFMWRVLAGLRLAGMRAVLLTGWGGAKAVTGDDVFVMEAAPHDWLFPRMRAVVHHGGSGTTGAGFRAGVPQVIVPFFGDQGLWGDRVAAVGAGVRLADARQLNAHSLADALRLTRDPAVIRRAGDLGEQVRAEQGVQSAVGRMTSTATRAASPA